MLDNPCIEALGRSGKKYAGLVYQLVCLQGYDRIIHTGAQRGEHSVVYDGPAAGCAWFLREPWLDGESRTAFIMEKKWRQSLSLVTPHRLLRTPWSRIAVCVATHDNTTLTVTYSGGMETMDIKRSGSQPSTKGPDAYFTGHVRIDPLFQAAAPGRVLGACVTFEPGARTAWHTHPLGQTLIVTSGCGWVQSEGGPNMDIRPGDVVWCPPHEKHWHGATTTTAMTHIAIQEALDGKVVEWMEKVSDEQYQA